MHVSVMLKVGHPFRIFTEYFPASPLVIMNFQLFDRCIFRHIIFILFSGKCVLSLFQWVIRWTRCSFGCCKLLLLQLIELAIVHRLNSVFMFSIRSDNTHTHTHAYIHTTSLLQLDIITLFVSSRYKCRKLDRKKCNTKNTWFFMIMLYFMNFVYKVR